MEQDIQSAALAQPRTDVFGIEAPLGRKRWGDQLDGEDAAKDAVVELAGRSCRTLQESAQVRSYSALTSSGAMKWGTFAFKEFTHSARGQLLTLLFSLRRGSPVPVGQPYKIGEQQVRDLVDRLPDISIIDDVVDWFWQQGEYAVPKSSAAKLPPGMQSAAPSSNATPAGGSPTSGT